MIEATSCGGVVIFRGKVLLLYKNYKNKYEGWVLPKGTVEKGEEHNQTALREVKEEVGVDLLPEKGHVILSDIKKIEFGKVVNKIVDVWLFEYDGEVDLSNATTDEVAQVAWMNRSQIKELFDANMFVDTLEYFFTEVEKEGR